MPPEENETPPAEAGEENVEETPQTDEANKEAEEETNDGGDELPEWAREKLTKANAEAANYRTKLRDAEAALESAKTPDEVEALLNGWKAEREEQERSDAEAARALLIENIALKHRLPEPLAKRLVGETREELEADAKALAQFAEADDEDIHLEGGLSPRDRDDDPEDPRALAAKYGGRKPRR